MSINLAKNITRRNWDTIQMPETVISCVKELSWNETNKFIFTYRICHLIGYTYTTGVDRDAADTNKNQAPQKPSQNLQATEEAEEDPVITYNNIELDINHETPTEKVQATHARNHLNIS